MNNRQLYSYYWNKNLSIKQISELCNRSDETIRYAMIKHNIPRRRMRNAVMIAKDSFEINFDSRLHSIGYILGVMHGDGSFCDRILRLRVKDKKFALRFKKAFIDIGYNKKIKISKQKDGTYLVQIYSVNLRDFFLTISFDMLTSKQKDRFIEGFFDSDGFILGTRNTIGCCNTNKELILTLSQYLSSIDIDNKINVRKGRCSTIKGRTIKQTKKIYYLYIYRKKSLINFCNRFKLFRRKNMNQIKILKRLSK